MMSNVFYIFPYLPDSLILSLSPCLSSLQVSSLVSRVTTFFSSSSRDNLANQSSARVTVSQSEGSLQNTPVAADFPLQVCDLVSVHKVTGLTFAIIYQRLTRESSVGKNPSRNPDVLKVNSVVPDVEVGEAPGVVHQVDGGENQGKLHGVSATSQKHCALVLQF